MTANAIQANHKIDAVMTNNALREKLNTARDFKCVFTDSWSQVAGCPNFNTEDQLQQE